MERIVPKPNPHELDKFNGIEMGKNQKGERIQTADGVPMIELFTRAQINRLTELKHRMESGKIDRPIPTNITLNKMRWR